MEGGLGGFREISFPFLHSIEFQGHQCNYNFDGAKPITKKIRLIFQLSYGQIIRNSILEYRLVLSFESKPVPFFMVETHFPFIFSSL